MKNTEAHRIHFLILIIGTAFYLFQFGGVVVIKDGIPEANVLGIAAFYRNTMFYLAFVVLVFGHALLWRSKPEDLVLSDEEEEVLEGMKERVKSR